METRTKFRTLALGLAVFVSSIPAINGGQLATAENGVETAESAREHLMTTGFFAFGGVGYGGVTSSGEKAFQTILGSTNALEQFRTVLRDGNPQARMYALVGIRKLAPKSFDEVAQPTLKENSHVRTMSGCLVREEDAQDVIERISNGTYDFFIQYEALSVNIKK